MIRQLIPEDLVWFKLALEDLKAFYEIFDCTTRNYKAGYVENIIYNETVLGEIISYYFNLFESNPKTLSFARSIASRAQVKRSTGVGQLIKWVKL